MIKAPCKDCIDREVGCHAVCKKYLQFQKDKEVDNQVRRDFNRCHNEHVGFMTEQKRRREKHHR